MHVYRQLDHFDQARFADGMMTAKAHAVLFEDRPVAVVELVAVAVALADLHFAVGLERLRVGLERARIGA